METNTRKGIRIDTARRLVGLALVVLGLFGLSGAKRYLRCHVYDRQHDAYRRWDATEGLIYKEFLEESRLPVKPFSKLAASLQDQYWRWRAQRRSEPDA